MDVHLSEEAARYIRAHLAESGCRSPSEFIERLLRELPSATTDRQAWLLAQDTAAAKIWENDADARYDAL
jgi:Arc/MetJ-type ribon-helix-helix transcriptional regulator